MTLCDFELSVLTNPPRVFAATETAGLSSPPHSGQPNSPDAACVFAIPSQRICLTPVSAASGIFPFLTSENE